MALGGTLGRSFILLLVLLPGHLGGSSVTPDEVKMQIIANDYINLEKMTKYLFQSMWL